MVTRSAAIKVCIMATAAAAILVPVMLAIACFGDPTRAFNMALALDETGNAMARGKPYMTISARTGLGVRRGLGWAIKLQPVIDGMFGHGHCQASAEGYLNRLNRGDA